MAKRLKTVVLAVLALAAFGIFASDLVRLWPRSAGAGPKAEDAVPTSYQAKVLADGRRQLPHRMDEVTVLESFEFDGRTLVYGYAVSVPKPGGIDVAAFKAAGLPATCATLNEAFRAGEIEAIRHHYTFSDGAVLALDITRPDCATSKSGEAPAEGNFITDFETSTGIDL